MSSMFLNTSSAFIVSTLSLLSTPYIYHQCPLSVYHHFHYQYIITFINVLHMPSTSINTSSVFIVSTPSLLSMPHIYYVCPLSVHHHYNQHGTFIIHVHYYIISVHCQFIITIINAVHTAPLLQGGQRRWAANVHPKSTNTGTEQHSKGIAWTQQQRPKLPTVTLDASIVQLMTMVTFITALFSTLEQSHCSSVACDSKRVTVAFRSLFGIPTQVVYLQCCLIVTWLVPRETAIISAHSVYTIQPCTMSCHFMQSHIQKVHAYLL